MTDTPYLDDAQLRAIDGLGNESLHPIEDLQQLLGDWERLVERARGNAFTTRTATETAPRRRHHQVVLRWPLVQAITAITIDGIAYTGTVEPDLATGIVHLPGQPCGILSVTYRHGLTEPPPAVLRGGRLYIEHERKAELNQTSNTYVTATIDAAGTQFVQREYTQDWTRDRFTGWGDVDRIIRQLPDHRTPGGW